MHAWRPSWAECDPIGMDAATIWNEAWRTARSSHRLTRQLMTLMKLVTTGHDKLQVWRRIQLMTERTINPCHVAISGKTPDLPDGESAEERGARSEKTNPNNPSRFCFSSLVTRSSKLIPQETTMPAQGGHWGKTPDKRQRRYIRQSLPGSASSGQPGQQKAVQFAAPSACSCPLRCGSGRS